MAARHHSRVNASVFWDVICSIDFSLPLPKAKDCIDSLQVLQQRLEDLNLQLNIDVCQGNANAKFKPCFRWRYQCHRRFSHILGRCRVPVLLEGGYAEAGTQFC